MMAETCLLDLRPRVSGQLWSFSPDQERTFKQSGVGGVKVDRDSKLLELRVHSGEKIVGAEFSSQNKVALWTERGNIFILTLKSNHYWKLGKPGTVNCLAFVASDPVNIAVGLKTKRVLVINTQTGAVRRRFTESEDIRQVGSTGDVVFTLTSHHLTLFSLAEGHQLLRSDPDLYMTFCRYFKKLLIYCYRCGIRFMD